MDIIRDLIRNRKILNIVNEKFGRDCGSIITYYQRRMELLENIDECLRLKDTNKVYTLNVTFKDFQSYCKEQNYIIIMEFVICVNYGLTYCLIPLDETIFKSSSINIRYIHINSNDNYMKLEFYLGKFKVDYSKVELFEKIPGNIFKTYLKYHRR